MSQNQVKVGSCRISRSMSGQRSGQRSGHGSKSEVNCVSSPTTLTTNGICTYMTIHWSFWVEVGSHKHAQCQYSVHKMTTYVYQFLNKCYINVCYNYNYCTSIILSWVNLGVDCVSSEEHSYGFIWIHALHYWSFVWGIQWSGWISVRLTSNADIWKLLCC